MLAYNHWIRPRKQIEDAIQRLQLSLNGLVVLTEAASGWYTLTPLIAALGGAEKVYALTRDSRFGSASEIAEATYALAKHWGVMDRLEVIFSRFDEHIVEADVVTNLGFVRPIDRALLERLKSTVAISLMYETWEFRSQDIDLPLCHKLGIPVLGTNEHHPDLQIFPYIGCVALKLAFNAGLEIFRSRIIVLGNGEFAEVSASAFRAAGASIWHLPVDSEGRVDQAAFNALLPSVDALFVVEHHYRDWLVGNQGALKPAQLAALNPELVVIHLCGGVERQALVSQGLICYPAHFAPAGYMTVATDYVGPRPLIDLHTAGLRIGHDLARARLSGLSRQEAEARVVQSNPLAQEFPAGSC